MIKVLTIMRVSVCVTTIISYHQFFMDLIKYECPVSFDYVDNQERTSEIYKLIVESEHLRKFFERLWRDCEDKDLFINGLVEYLKAKDKLVIEYEVVKEERESHSFIPDDKEKELLAEIKRFDDIISRREARREG